MSTQLLNAEQLALELFSTLDLDASTDFYLALSGGQDSCVLLDLMCQLAQSRSEKALSKEQSLSLTILHFDHALQPQSEGWARHCDSLAKRYEVPIVIKRHAVQVDPDKGLEASARKARYTWFAEEIAGRKRSADSSKAVLLTAHHANDQAETLLLNLMRGTGVSGLRGIARKKHHQSYTLVRPLLDFNQQQISAYAEENQLQWIDDPSNEEQRFRRNAIRAQVLPALNAIKPDAVQQFVKSADHMVATERLLSDLAKNDLQTIRQHSFCPLDQSLGICLKDIKKLGETLGCDRQSNVLRYWLQDSGYALNSQLHFQQLLDWANAGAGEKSELRNGDRVYRGYRNTLFVMPFMISKPANPNLIWHDLSAPLEISFGDVNYDILCQSNEKRRAYSNVRILFAKQAREQFSLKKRFQSAAVPHWRRDITPILVNDNEIIGIAGSEKDTWLTLKAR